MKLWKKLDRKTFLLFVASVAATFISFYILVMRVFYPFHREVAIGFYLCSWVVCTLPFIKRRTIIHIRENPEYKFIGRHKHVIIGVLLSAFFLFALVVLFPVDRFDFIRIDPTDFNEKADQDIVYLEGLLTSVDQSFATLDESGLLELEVGTANPVEVAALKEQFAMLLDQLIHLEQISDEYKYFYQINRFTHKDEHNKALLLMYASYIAKYKLVHDLSVAVETEYVETLLNEEIPPFGDDQYLALRTGYTDPATALRINTGRAYLTRMNPPDGAESLLTYSQRTYGELFTKVPSTIRIGYGTLLDVFEKYTWYSWLPVQKKVTATLAEVRVGRHENFISFAQLAEAEALMEPGDIIFVRRNWYATNPGMPGFWTHSGIYTGSLETMDAYFAEEAPLLLGMSFLEYVETNAPEFYADHHTVDKDGYAFKTLEVKEPGVIMLSWEESAKADYLSALRPRLSKEDKLKALLLAIEDYGKPYDFEFDFSTDDTYVCSELLYKAFAPRQDKEGLTYGVGSWAGRPMLAPNTMVQTFASRYGTEDQQNDFVLFLDGSEEKQEAEWSTVDEYMVSWQRSKYDFLLE